MRLPMHQADMPAVATPPAAPTPTRSAASSPAGRDEMAAPAAPTARHDARDAVRDTVEGHVQHAVRLTRLQMAAAGETPVIRPDEQASVGGNGLSVGTASTGPAFAADRTLLSVSGPIVPSHDITMAAGFAAGNTSLGVTAPISPDTKLAGFVSMTTSHMPGVGTTLGHTFQAGTAGAVGVAAGLFVMGGAKYNIQAEGLDDDAATMKVSQTKYIGVQATASGGSHGVGVGMRYWAEKGSSREFVTKLEATQDGQAAVATQNFIKQTMRGVNMLDRPVLAPKAAQLERLGSGDSIKEDRSYLTAKSVAVSAAGLYAGAHRLNMERSSVKVTRPEDSAKPLSATMERIAATTTTASLDLPFAASATQSKTSMVRTELTLETLSDESLLPMLTPRSGLLNRQFSLPFEFSLEAAHDPMLAQGEFFRQAGAMNERGVTLVKATIDNETTPASRQASVFPLIKALFNGNSRAGLSYERSKSKRLLHTEVSAGLSRVMEGFESTRRSEFPLRGARLFASAVLNVTEFTINMQDPTSALQQTGTFLRLRRSHDSATTRVLDDQTSWLRELMPSLLLPARPEKLALPHTFELETVVMVSLTDEDRVKVAAQGLLEGVEPLADNADPTQRASHRNHFERTLANAGEPAVRRIMRALDLKDRIRIDLKTNLAVKVAKRVTHSLIKLPSYVAKTQEVSGRKLVKSVDVLTAKKDELELADTAMRMHPLFSATPLDTKRERDVLAVARKAVHQMARKTRTLAAPAPAKAASKQTRDALYKLERVKSYDETTAPVLASDAAGVEAISQAAEAAVVAVQQVAAEAESTTPVFAATSLAGTTTT